MKIIPGENKLGLSDLSIVKSPSSGKMLRATVTWRNTTQAGNILAVSLVGCLIRRDKAGMLQFNAPISKNNRMIFNNILTSPYFAQIVVEIVANSKYASKIGTDLAVDPDEVKYLGETLETEIE